MKVQKMKAIVATAYGNHEVLQLQQVDRPQPKGNEILVQVVSCSATTADIMMVSGEPRFSRLFMGLKKPKCEITGTGFAGTVVAVGEKVTQFKIGDDVFGETGLGFASNAEYICMPEDGVVLPQTRQSALFGSNFLWRWTFNIP